jgi:hypothetical protein
MRNTICLLLLLVFAVSCTTKPGSGPVNLSDLIAPDTADITNNFYDNTETVKLPLAKIVVDGEISNPGEIDLSGLPVRSVIVKETLLDSAGGNNFVGAYRYDGYSLFDILNKVVPAKKNAGEFNPIIDLFVEITNNKGEKVVFSWGEIYYPNSLHKIIIAGSVSRIVPSRLKELWPLPTESRIVSSTDLITERNISSPVKITIRSFPRSLEVNRNINPLYSESFDLYKKDAKIGTLSPVKEPENVTYNTIFYGRGRGIHSTSPFYGMLLKDIIQKYYPADRQNLRSGMFCISGKDGYRCAVAYSELFNRNDQQEFLLVRTEKSDDGGLFRVFPAADFFSDRAVKSLTGIYLELF